jgi:hypothetical protein
MTKIQKIFLLFFILFLAAIPAWRFLIAPELLKLPGDYKNTVNFKRLSNTNHQINGEWTGEELVKGFAKEQTIRIDGNTQIIEGLYQAQDLNNKILWEVKKEYGVERSSHKLQNGFSQHAKDTFYLLPPSLKKQTYNVWFTQYLYPVELTFREAEEIQGLVVYHFSAENFIFDDSAGFEWLNTVPELYKVLTDGTINVWIEPTSGVIVDYKGGGVAYYADKITEEKVQDMQTWSNEYSNDTVVNQVRLAQNAKQQIFLYERWIPVLLGLISLAFLVALFASRRVAITPKSKQL